jgi:hypothetical protein
VPVPLPFISNHFKFTLNARIQYEAEGYLKSCSTPLRVTSQLSDISLGINRTVNQTQIKDWNSARHVKK